MGWTFFWLMVVLKIPIIAAIALVWWAIRSVPAPEAHASAHEDDDDGGSKVPQAHRGARPLRPRPRPRGPHGAPPPSPARVRTRVKARSSTRA